MNEPYPVTLEGHGIRLEPLAYQHHDELRIAAADGNLWELWFTAVPEPDQTRDYIASALAGQEAGHMLPWAVRELTSGSLIGSTRFHDIVAAVDRVEIGYTWYAKAGNGVTSIPVASSCCSAMRSTRLDARWSASAPTISTLPPSERSRRWVPGRTASSVTTRRAATARCATV